jgi:hypothetical protein
MMQSALRAIAVCGERMLILAAESRAFVAAIIVCFRDNNNKSAKEIPRSEKNHKFM